MIRRALVAALFLVVPGAMAQIAVEPPAIVPTSGLQSYPAITAAASGDRFLVAWEQRMFDSYPETAATVYRMYDADGTPLDTLPRTFGRGGNSPSVVWNGSEFYGVSANALSRFGSIIDLPVAYGERFDRSGARIPNSSTVLASARTSSAVTRVAWNGRRYLALAAGVAMDVIAADGAVLRSVTPVQLPLAGTSGTFLTSTALLDDDGNTITSVPIGGDSAAGASHGSEYAAVATSTGYRSAAGTDIMIVNTRGEITGRRTVANAPASTPAVVWSGDSYLAAWASWSGTAPDTTNPRICFVRFTATSASAPQCVARTLMPSSIALAASDRKTLVAWTEQFLGGGSYSADLAGGAHTAFTALDGMPDLRDATTASVELQRQTAPSLSSDSTGVTASWTDSGDTSVAMVGGLDASHTAVTPSALGSSIFSVSAVRMASDGRTTLAVWSEGGARIRGCFTSGGKPIAPPFDIGAGSIPATAFNGEQWLVVWDSPQGQLVSSIVMRGGIVVSRGGIPLSPSNNLQMLPAVASRGGDFLVCWIEGSDLHAIGVAAAGQVSGSDMNLASGQITALDVAASGRLYLIAVVTLGRNIGLPVTSTIPDILVGGFASGPATTPLRVRPRPAGGFTVLSDRFTFIDRDGNDSPGGVIAGAADFVYFGDTMVVAAVRNNRVFLDVYGPRRRAAARHATP